MVDSGATSVFIHKRIVQEFKIPTIKLDKPKKLRVIDGREIDSGMVDKYVQLEVEIFGHSEILSAYVVNTGHNDMVLGMSWLKCHDPTIVWKKGWVTFNSEYCRNNCLQHAPQVLAGKTPDLELKAAGILPDLYKSFADVFTEGEMTELPPHRPFDISIDLKSGATPRHGPIYSVSVKEDEELKKNINNQLAAGHIRPSKSPMASPVIFVKKKNGKLRMCIDYRKLNDMTIKNAYPLPLVKDLLITLRKAKIFTKLDLKWGYNLVRIKEGDEWKAAFKTKYGLFEPLVMQFGLANAPAVFMHFMNEIFRDLLGITVVVYMDDILIFSETEEEHVNHMSEVLRRLKENKLYCAMEKCTFHVSEIDYLGLIIAPGVVKVDPAKVTKAVEWDTPENVTDIQSFIGFLNFYGDFIEGFRNIAKPLYGLTKKGIQWKWSEKENEAFLKLKEALRTAPVLIQPDPEKQYFLECDASDYATGAVLSQIGPDEKMHPVGFLSKSMNEHERRYTIHNKELLAVIRAFKLWRHLLEGTEKPVIVLSDHKNLEGWKTNVELRGRVARWQEVLSRYNFRIFHIPGRKNGKADILSRLRKLRPEGGGESSALLPENLFIQAITPDHDLERLIQEAYIADEYTQKVIKALEENEKVKHWEWEDGLLRYKGKIWIPNNKSIRKLVIESRHDSLAAGHPGQFRTYELLNRKYIWSSMKKSVNEYVANCESCIRNKHSNQVPPGLLNPIEAPDKPWEEITFDLITQLPESEGFTAILTVVDRLTKMVHFIPTTNEANGVDVANRFLTYVWKLHGLPRKTISDRGPQFTSQFLKQLHKRLDIKPSFSTAYHPQTDGQTERLNQVVELYLRHYVSHRQDDWVGLLPLAEFAYNNGVNVSTGKTPFFANYGFHPKFAVGDKEGQGLAIADNHAEWLQKGYDELKAALTVSQERMKEYYDRKHRAPEEIKVGDQVWLDNQNIQSQRPARKLAAKRIGPFKVLAKIGKQAFKLELPHTLKIHPVFPVALLSLKRDDPYERDPPQPPPEVTPEGDIEYEVEQVQDSRRHRGKIQYYVKWLGYNEWTWEPYEHLTNAPELIADFHRRHPRALRHPQVPRPPRT
ncbi:Retrotransposable element Tf2 protein [Ceratobasidium sp. AG-Ba]|nr:Retrotransposable element Tf2 protein [Ceratobasidium sp. AG-Ba]